MGEGVAAIDGGEAAIDRSLLGVLEADTAVDRGGHSTLNTCFFQILTDFHIHKIFFKLVVASILITSFLVEIKGNSFQSFNKLICPKCSLQ